MQKAPYSHQVRGFLSMDNQAEEPELQGQDMMPDFT